VTTKGKNQDSSLHLAISDHSGGRYDGVPPIAGSAHFRALLDSALLDKILKVYFGNLHSHT